MRRAASTTTQTTRRALDDLTAVFGAGRVSTDALAIATAAVDASHYLLNPAAVVRAASAAEVAAAMQVAHSHRLPLTFRSGGTSLSGQGLTRGLLVDVRAGFRSLEVLDEGLRVRTGPGLTVREVNAHLARHGRKLGPDPASEIACTIGGVIANNSSGMTCGVVANTYQTLESLVFVLPSGTVVDTGEPEASARLRSEEPALVAEIEAIRDHLRADRAVSDDLRRRWSIKNTMGYGLNSLVDFDDPVAILQHLVVGSEGTLGFIAEAIFRTLPVLPQVATGLLLFDTLHQATSSLPHLVASGAAVIELLDEASLAVCRLDRASQHVIPSQPRSGEAALLVEYQAGSREELQGQTDRFSEVVTEPAELDSDPDRRAQLWQLRKGLFTKVAGARPTGTTALLEDVAVPVEALAGVCADLQHSFDDHGYPGSVIFGHAKDGNIHFLVNEDFRRDDAVERYAAFTEDMVEIVLQAQGTLKAEHGTGRIMAPFVERQYGTELTDLMWRIKNAFDPHGVLNPDSVLTRDPELHLKDLKRTPEVSPEIDVCVECGYCEPVCPSQFLTLTPRQRIVAQRAIVEAEQNGDLAKATLLRDSQQFPVIDTCAVDGMCQTACPVGINTGDLVRRLRREQQTGVWEAGWDAVAQHWSSFGRVAALGMTVVDAVPTAAVNLPLRAARAVLGADRVPLLSSDLPAGGRARRAISADQPVAVYFPSCVQTMFGGGDLQADLLWLASKAGLPLRVPEGIGGLCCGTPWKSKGLSAGQTTMVERTSAALLEATEGGRLTVVCDATSCTEGLAQSLAALPQLQVMDALEFAATQVLPGLGKVSRVGSAVLHPTCSSTQLGLNGHLTALGQAVAERVETAPQWRCCGFAGDRGLLHPELTAAATRDEAEWITQRDFDLYLSANRTCEIGMHRATGQPWQHVIQALALAAR